MSEKRVLKRRSNEEKLRIVEETLCAGASVSIVARRHDVNANQVFAWRQQYRRGELGGDKTGSALVPVGVIGEGGIVSTVADAPTQHPAYPTEARPEPQPVAIFSKQPKMIEVELRGGTRIKIDADVKGAALQQVLKLIRSLA